MSLEVKHLTHTYSAGSAFQATAVHDVSLTIEDGEFVCIVGHTGSGKSTLVQHLNGLLKPTSGQVLVDGSVDAIVYEDDVPRGGFFARLFG